MDQGLGFPAGVCGYGRLYGIWRPESIVRLSVQILWQAGNYSSGRGRYPHAGVFLQGFKHLFLRKAKAAAVLFRGCRHHLQIIQGESITAEIDEQIVYDQLDDDEQAVWSLLLASGYLKVKLFRSENMDSLLALVIPVMTARSR